MKLIIEDAFDHYQEDPDNAIEIAKAEKHADKLADKPLSKVKPPKFYWIVDTGKGQRVKYLSTVNGGYTYNKLDALKMTSSQAIRSLNILKDRFKVDATLYQVTDLFVR